MTNVDPLIQRELSSMELGIYANRDLTPLIVAKVRRRRIRRAIISASIVLGLLLVGSLSYGVIKYVSNHSFTSSTVITAPAKGVGADQIKPIESKYPIEKEPNTGDSNAISSAAGLGETIFGLTAVAAKVDWKMCVNNVPCPSEISLTLRNPEGTPVGANIAINIFMNHSVVSSSYAPTSVSAGGDSVISVKLDEIKDSDVYPANAIWTWSWFILPNEK